MNRFSAFLVLIALLFSVQTPAFTILYSQTNVSCNGGSNGAIDLTPTGGIQPYVFSWSNSATTEDLIGLSAGIYSVTVTDATPSVQTATFIITQPTPLVMNATGTSSTCYGSNNGIVMANMVQGTGPYTWTLNGPPSMTPNVMDENFQWVRQGGGIGALDNQARAICSDRQGNVYATGSFYNTISMGNAVMTSSGNSDIFIARYTSSGTLVWARRVGGIGYDSGMGIACDTLGNIFVTGNFRNTVTFGTYTLTSYDVDDSFIAKYDANGNCLWVYHPVSTSSDICWSIAVDASGNCYVSGYFTGTMTFSPLASMTAPSGFSVVVAKLNSSGLPLWSKISSGSSFNQGTALAIDNAGNIFICGYFSATCTFGAYSVTSVGFRDIFLAKYNNNGVEQWARSAGSSGFDDYGMDVCTDNLGNAYITGYFRSTITFGSNSVTSAGADDMFLAKYNSAGTSQWAVRGGGSLLDHGNGVHCDQNNNIYVTGFYYSTAIFGSFTLTPGGFNELFVALYNSSGAIQNIKGVNGPNYEEGYCVYNDQRGSTYVSGMFGSTTGFGGIPMTALGTHDFFVSRFSMTSAIDTVYNLVPGNYTATVTDFNGCTASASVNITQPPAIIVTPTVIAPICNGGLGSVTLAISGGTPNYSTNWGSSNPNALNSGNYAVTITDASGCDTTISITVTQPPALLANGSLINESCMNDCNGSISLVPSGGIPGYSFLWNNSSTASSISALCAGTYSVSITDANSCMISYSATITSPAQLLISSILTNNDTLCTGQCTNISVSINGGTPAYTYNWQPITGLSNSVIQNPIACPTASTTYSLTATDLNGCTVTDSVSLVVDICLGIVSDEKRGLLIYPNPSSGIFTIDLGGIKMADGSSIILRDVSGRILETIFSTQKDIMEIGIQNFADGIYFMELHTDDGEIICTKLSKQ